MNIEQIRTALGLTQMELGALLGVHFMTVSRWERGIATPSDYHASLMARMGEVRAQGLGRLLMSEGVVVALSHALSGL